ncbi:hypothetical protein [Kingella potus]|nr:hypothetical protein [Kingella potus]
MCRPCRPCAACRCWRIRPSEKIAAEVCRGRLKTAKRVFRRPL